MPWMDELSQQVSAGHDVLTNVLKIGALAGSLCGFIYLMAYTSSAGIPFPFELSILPTTLLVIGATSLIGTLVVLGGILIPALMADDPLKATNGYFLADDAGRHKGRARYKRYFFCVWMPMATALLALLVNIDAIHIGPWDHLIARALIGMALAWIVLTPRFVVALRATSVPYIFTMVFQTLFAVFSYLVLVVIGIAIVPEMEGWPAWVGCLLILAVFTMLHALVSVPPVPQPGSTAEGAPATTTACILACVMAVGSVLMPQINSKVGKVALMGFKMGGGIPAIICLKEAPPTLVAQRIHFGPDHCSAPLLILLDGGDRVFVTHNANPTQIKPDAAQQVEPISFLQDELRNKIYLRPKKNRKQS